MRRLVSGTWLDLLPAGIIILVLSATAGFLEPAFFSGANAQNILFTWSLYLPAALGLGGVMIFGKFDLSIGAVAALTGVIFGTLVLHDNLFVALAALPAAAGIALLIGFTQAHLILNRRTDTLITTLAVAGIAQSLALIVTQGRVQSGLPDHFLWLKSAFFLVPNIVWICAAASIFFFFLFERTIPFRRAYFVGQNIEGARALGAPVVLYQTIAFCACSLGAAFTGLIQSSRTSSASPLVAADLALLLIASCVLGGSRLTGGFGNAVGIAFGLLAVVLIRNFVVIADVDVYWQPLVVGLAMIFGSLWHNRKNA